MSYDVQVWSVRQPVPESALPKASTWEFHGDSWSLAKLNWQVTVSSPDAVLPEDIPGEISKSIPGISFLTELNLEPIGAPDLAKKILLQAANALAKASHGLVYNGQTDELTLPGGVKRFAPRARDERFSILELAWWFLDDGIFLPERLNRLLDIFVALLPEAMPRRYGLYEPPQYSLAAEGREHLLKFLRENLDNSPVLYPTRPVVGLEVSCTKEHHHPRLGFRANRLSVEFEASVLDQPGWHEGLRRFWLAVSAHLNPFFSDVRTLKGFLPMGPTYGSDVETEVHPIRSWFWRGVPRELGHAAAIGEPYVELLQRASVDGHRHGNLLVLDTGKWDAGDNLTIEVPEGLLQKSSPKYQNDGCGQYINWVDEYPEIWPFDVQY